MGDVVYRTLTMSEITNVGSINNHSEALIVSSNLQLKSIEITKNKTGQIRDKS